MRLHLSSAQTGLKGHDAGPSLGPGHPDLHHLAPVHKPVGGEVEPASACAVFLPEAACMGANRLSDCRTRVLMPFWNFLVCARWLVKGSIYCTTEKQQLHLQRKPKRNIRASHALGWRG